MRQVTVTADIPGDGDNFNTAPVVLDQYIAPFQVSFLSSNDGTVQVTFTDPYPVVNQDFVEADYDWRAVDINFPNAINFLNQPVRAIRLKNATAGTTLTVIQSGVK